MAASVAARLLTRSKETGQTHQLLLQRYVSERFLFRLGQSSHHSAFILKGATLFGLWGGSIYRPTRDLDFTGYGSSEPAAVIGRIREVCAVPVDDDGVTFDLASIEGGTIREDAEYGGIRTKFMAYIGKASISMQVDIGFGNAIQPGPTDSDYPTLLPDSPPPRVLSYPKEAVVAEKLHAMVVLGDRNSRFKDFYDLYVLATTFAFNGAELSRAIRATFERRRTVIDTSIPRALTPTFYEDAPRAALWRAYISRNELPGAPAEFAEVYVRLSRFLTPVWTAIAATSSFESAWPAGGPWATP